MIIEFKKRYLADLLSKMPSYCDKLDHVERYEDPIPDDDYLNSIMSHKHRNSLLDLDLNMTPIGFIEELYQAAKDQKSADYSLFLKMSRFRKLAIYGSEGVRIKQIQDVKDVLIKYLHDNTYNGLVAYESKHGNDTFTLYYYVMDVRYHPPRPGDYPEPAYVSINTVYNQRGKATKKEFTLEKVDIDAIKGDKGCTVAQILLHIGLYTVDETMYNDYKRQYDDWINLIGQTGNQYTIKDDCFYKHDYKWVYKTNKDQITKLVMDEYEPIKNTKLLAPKSPVVPSGGDHVLEIPVHPYVKVFDLELHVEGLIATDYIIPYEYDKEVITKLVLPKSTKDFIDILLGGVDDIKDEIIKGKTGGIITLLSGPPGTGKTLTAEVYSELIGVPLYKVQSTQLGIKIDTIEKNLKEILDRASRWGAVLLMDECDVYTRKRGDDLIQNAIVGVFLRVLEYYSGILFLTTNLPDSTDDAIVSRCIAHLKYDHPDMAAAIKIADVLAKAYKLDVSSDTLDSFILKYHTGDHNLSGRDIKYILRLAGMVANRKKEKVTMETIDYVAGFHGVEPLGVDLV